MSVSGCELVHWSAVFLLKHFHHLMGVLNINRDNYNYLLKKYID